MDYQEIIAGLQSMASEKYKANVVRMGIPKEHCIGVATGDVRKLAKTVGKSNELAYELWESGYHEARLLAVLVFDKKNFTLDEAKRLMADVVSWDLCDHLCKNLIMKLKGCDSLITLWVGAEETYKKRAAFTLMSASVVHDKSITGDVLSDYLRLISEHSCDEREHVKKAVSTALREIGKKDFNFNEKAILLAHEMKDSDNKAQVWIARDALKELENMVKAEGRGRLISTASQMGRDM